MERLSPKGDKSLEAIPLGRMGDGGEHPNTTQTLYNVQADDRLSLRRGMNR